MNIQALKETTEKATPWPHHIYTHPRDDNNYAANEAYHEAVSPQTVLAMIRVIEATRVVALHNYPSLEAALKALEEL